MKKLLSSLLMAGLLVVGGFSAVGCSGTATTAPKVDGDPKAVAKKAVEEAKAAQKKAEDALKDNKDDAKKKDLEKAVDDAKAAVKKAEDALDKIK